MWRKAELGLNVSGKTQTSLKKRRLESSSRGSKMKISSKRQRRFDDSMAGFLFILPALAFLGVLIVYPLFNSFYISLFKTNLINIWVYCGFENYASHFLDIETWQSLRVTLIYTAAVVAGALILGMISALVLNAKIRGQVIYRTIVMWPWILSSVAAVVMWKWMYSTQYGVINDILYRLNLIENPVSWLGQMDTALPALIVMSIWKAFPFVAISLLAGLQSIPIELYEAAEVDGATGWHKWRYITIPSISDIIRILAILETVWYFREFGLVNMLTGGGPIRSTETINIRAYRFAFEFFEFGKASSLGIIIFLICLVLMLIYIKGIPSRN